MTGIILAGGRSRRMGKDKAFIEVAGKRIIDRTVHLFQKIFSHVVVVTNSPAPYAYLGVTLVTDLMPGYGALGGLFTGLFFSPTSHIFLVACDMPLLDPKVIQYLTERSHRWDVVVPKIDGMLEPLHAIYSQNCLKPIETALRQRRKKLTDFFPKVRTLHIPEEEIRALDPDLISFRNINTPEDLAAFQKDFQPVS